MSVQRSEPRSPEDFGDRVGDLTDSKVLSEFLRERYAWELLSYCTDGLEPRSPREFSECFLEPLAELDEEDIRAVRNVYRRYLWRCVEPL